MKRIFIKTAFFVNYIMLILHVCYRVRGGHMDNGNLIPYIIATLMLIDVTYVSACNVRTNKVLLLFCGLLALDSWYLVLSVEENAASRMLFNALSPIIWFVSIRFIFLFLFQGSGYKYRKMIHGILLMVCLGTLVALAVSERGYALMYGAQFLVNLMSFLFVVCYNWNRVVFVLKSEWKSILLSFGLITILFFIYYYATLRNREHITNFGIYLPLLLFFMSINGIVNKKQNSIPFSTIFSKRQSVGMIGVFAGLMGAFVYLIEGGIAEIIVSVNILFAYIYLGNIVLGENLKRGQSIILKEGKYQAALRQMQQEEQLKTEFATFLHDDVLQDLLSIKNMMTKAQRPEIKEIIIETLDDLNVLIRGQMQDYHPILLKNLTTKENYQHLIHSVAQAFGSRSIEVSLECSDTLFLVEPYNVLVYRLIKELLTNVYKHSDGNHAWISLKQINCTIELEVRDDGSIGASGIHLSEDTKYKGLASIYEQVNQMEGVLRITDNAPHGISLRINIPMKGGVSYQYFIS